ncbi:hypothetical protein Glove_74g262 [Diversispora epigaea]|uniref:Uncharacterized protein n=1 Tax=Diversispora epigaea TaxID=1348612 RepID=A0A397JIK2_9GLOM|nr:hypothetical protein Glove_74g262 [Diversispora epigaea]
MTYLNILILHITLTLLYKRFYNISSRPTARQNWIIHNMDEHTRFISFYSFWPQLNKCSGDKKPIELKIEHDAGQINVEKLKQKSNPMDLQSIYSQNDLHSIPEEYPPKDGYEIVDN